MAEMEKLKADGNTYKAFATLKTTTKMALEKAYNAVKEKDDGTDDMDNPGI
jgi:hypothetical protein